jgi:hypothetical protein
MKSPTTPRLVFIFLLAVLSSAVAGALLMRAWTLRQADARRPHLIAERFQQHLDLDAVQTEQVRALVEALMMKMRETPPGDLAALAAGRREFATAMRRLLTAGQRERYDAFLMGSQPDRSAP